MIFNYKYKSAVNASKLHVHGLRRRRVWRLLSYERGEARKRRSRSGHIVHHYLTSVEAHHGAAFGLRVCVAGVVPHRPLSLPRLSQRIVHVGVMVYERVRLRSDALVFTLRILREYQKETLNIGKNVIGVSVRKFHK